MRDDIMSTELLPNLKHMLAGNDTGLKVSTLWVINNLTYRCAGYVSGFHKRMQCPIWVPALACPTVPKGRSLYNLCRMCLALPNPNFPAVMASYTTTQV